MNRRNLRARGALTLTFIIAAALVSPASADPVAARDKTISVLRAGSPPEIVHVVTGTMPSRAMAAVTLTDENCQPDARGMSHCLNELQLANGQTILVRHDHDMRVVPCLTPGEKVQVAPTAV